MPQSSAARQMFNPDLKQRQAGVTVRKNKLTADRKQGRNVAKAIEMKKVVI